MGLSVKLDVVQECMCAIYWFASVFYLSSFFSNTQGAYVELIQQGENLLKLTTTMTPNTA